jgi:hypothetical protein
MTQRSVMAVLIGGCLLVSAAVALGARQTAPARTLVQVGNKGRAEAVPVTMQDEVVAVRAAGTPLKVAIAQADQPIPVTVIPARPQWEYSEVKFATGESPVSALSAASAQGWEVTGITYVVSGRNAVLIRRLRN